MLLINFNFFETKLEKTFVSYINKLILLQKNPKGRKTDEISI